MFESFKELSRFFENLYHLLGKIMGSFQISRIYRIFLLISKICEISRLSGFLRLQDLQKSIRNLPQDLLLVQFLSSFIKNLPMLQLFCWLRSTSSISCPDFVCLRKLPSEPRSISVLPRPESDPFLDAVEWFSGEAAPCSILLRTKKCFSAIHAVIYLPKQVCMLILICFEVKIASFYNSF